MTCIETYLQAKAAADQQLNITLAGCNGSPPCEDAAVASYQTTMNAANSAYLDCRNGAGGGGGGES